MKINPCENKSSRKKLSQRNLTKNPHENVNTRCMVNSLMQLDRIILHSIAHIQYEIFRACHIHSNACFKGGVTAFGVWSFWKNNFAIIRRFFIRTTLKKQPGHFDQWRQRRRRECVRCKPVLCFQRACYFTPYNLSCEIDSRESGSNLLPSSWKPKNITP